MYLGAEIPCVVVETVADALLSGVHNGTTEFLERQC